jgi:ribosomal protein L14
MVGVGSVFLTNDNSGVKQVRCLKIPKVLRHNTVKLGDYIVVAVNKGQYKKKFSFKKLCFGLVLTRRRITKRKSGYYLRFGANRVILFSNKEKSIGNRLYGFITLECRYFYFAKIVNLARFTI